MFSIRAARYVTPPSSRPEEAALLKAAVERDGSVGQTDGIFGSDEFPVEANNIGSSVCGEITCRLLGKLSECKTNVWTRRGSDT